MITFKAIVISSNRRKDGTYPVKIRVTFKGVSRRLATTLVCTPADLTRSLHIKSADILNKSEALISSMRTAIQDISPFDLDNHDVDWVVDHIKTNLAKDNFHLDFFEWADQYLMSKKKATRNGYVTAINAFSRFLGKREIDINSITRSMIVDFMQYIDNEPKVVLKGDGFVKTDKTKSKSASAVYTFMLTAIFNAAKEKYNDEDADKLLIPKSPFSKVKKNRIQKIGQRNLGRDIMQRIISYETDNPKMRMALDTFIVSFGLMGANMVDLYGAKASQEVWKYNRSKTRDRRSDRAEMRIELPEQLAPYIARLRGRNGHWLCLADLYKSKDLATAAVNKQLQNWCKSEGVEKFTLYAARHSFASIGRADAKIEKATIDDCLAHVGDYSVTDIYAEKAWDLMNEANRKILELFEWPDQ